MTQQKGFTLIELLVVIAIVAVLSVVVILTLNPAELLKQARDSNRVSDMSTLKGAISLYMADGQSEWNPAALTCYTTASSSGTRCGLAFAAWVTTTSTGTGGGGTNLAKNDGTGWVPINFVKITSGAPFGQLPVDAINNATNFYGFAATSTTGNPSQAFKFVANMESAKYGNGGSSDVESTDGGTVTSFYEVGTLLTL